MHEDEVNARLDYEKLNVEYNTAIEKGRIKKKAGTSVIMKKMNYVNLDHL